MGDGGERHAPATFSSGKGTGTLCTGGEVGARTGLVAPNQGVNPEPTQTTPSRLPPE